ncbi:hypothetical protein QN277_000656 [Acacia crassicarpa]|uniref:Uncharacterized protein n=1 Tax=Acacia crassicarpa TaxID=499986 RepID=A0AAE1N5T8_9FABA|nr:hypothetical protein QN277_000656 [Acacia crassicarpa]
MASHSQPADTKLVVSTSPKSDNGAGKGHCLCSPTTHEGSFRCRLHRSSSSSSSSSTPWIKRSNSMPGHNKHALPVSPPASAT